MLIPRHTRKPGVNIYEWCSSFGPLVRAYLRAADVDYLGVKELQRVNKCIMSHITDFEQAILAQVSEKWKPITLADGAFDLDELKRDISSSDVKFAVRKYKPSALILEYLTYFEGIKAASVTSLFHSAQATNNEEEKVVE
jgi:hypothetical protein